MSGRVRGQPWKTVVFGSGRMAREHAIALTRHPDFTLAGLVARASPRRDSLVREFAVPFTSENALSAYEQCNPDCAIIAVAVEGVERLLETVLNYPWTVLAEKPLGWDLAQTERLISAGRGRTDLFVAMNRRHYRGLRAAFQAIAKDQSPRLVVVHDQEDVHHQAGLGRPREVLERWMFINSVHLVDLVRWFARGDLINLKTTGLRSFDQPQELSAHVTFASGDQAFYTCRWNMPGPWSIGVRNESVDFYARPIERTTIRYSDRSSSKLIVEEDVDGGVKAGLLGQLDELALALSGREHSLPSWRDVWESVVVVNEIFA